MHRNYQDIYSRIATDPVWWTWQGVPRYEPFSPERSGGVYSSELALVEIACQMSDLRFLVVLEGDRRRQLSAAIRNSALSYGDPPNVSGVSPFTSSLTVRVLEYWSRDHEEYVIDNEIVNFKRYSEWRRDSSLEVAFPDEHDGRKGIFWSLEVERQEVALERQSAEAKTSAPAPQLRRGQDKAADSLLFPEFSTRQIFWTIMIALASYTLGRLV